MLRIASKIYFGIKPYEHLPLPFIGRVTKSGEIRPINECDYCQGTGKALYWNCPVCQESIY